jgi:uncharacterized protein (TIGR02594 family)
MSTTLMRARSAITPAQRARWGAPRPAAPPWIRAAWPELDEREVRGGENGRIVGYHRTTTLRAAEDEVPWCASFVNWALVVSGVRGTNDARAISFAERSDLFRTLVAPRYGCILVIRHRGAVTRATGSWSGNHVAFYERATLAPPPPVLTLLGGNQGDAVSLANFALAGGPTPGFDVLGAYWPRAVPLPDATDADRAVAAAWTAAKRLRAA